VMDAHGSACSARAVTARSCTDFRLRSQSSARFSSVLNLFFVSVLLEFVK
jgi:hypothetical protein